MLFINPLNFYIMQLINFSESIAFCEAQGLALCFQAYADNCAGESIFEIGFNPNSGYVYIALENDIQICSCLGREVWFMVSSIESGSEDFFTSYQKALEIVS